MLFKYIKKLKTKIISLILLIYLMLSIFVVVNAESYEWTLTENIDVVTTNANVEENSNIENISSADTMNLECESAILIEQTTR